jgi:MFS family permease
MMFLQYAAVGVCAPILPSYLQTNVEDGGLGFSVYQVGWILAIAPAIGSMLAPFIAGQFVDRHVATERYLAAAFLVSGAAQWFLSYQHSFPAWAALSLVFALGFYPTIGLANALAMAHLRDAQTQFPRVRVWGTVGWVVVAWTFPMLFLQESFEFRSTLPFFGGADRSDATARIAMALQVSAAISFGFAVFCLLLPNTPPKQSGKDRFAFVTAFRLLRHRSLIILIFVSIALAAMDRILLLQTAPYLQSVGVRTSQVMPAMAIGQLAEIVMMLLLGHVLKRIGFRFALLLGAFCYVLRFIIFAAPALSLEVIVGSQLLHGICFACAFIVVAIYIDRLAPPDARNSAQSGLTLAVMAPGAILGGLLNGLLGTWFTVGGRIYYSSLWYSCAGISVAAFLGLFFLFRDESEKRGNAE